MVIELNQILLVKFMLNIFAENGGKQELTLQRK